MARSAIKKRKQKAAENGEDDDEDEEDEKGMKKAFVRSVAEDKKLHKAVGKVAKKVGVKPPAED